MKFQTVKFTSGHELRDNGVGDYGLWCPAKGNCGFMHVGQVMAIVNQRCACSDCGQEIGEVVSGKAYEPLDSTYT